LEWGYVVLLATLVQAVLAGIALILLPLWLGRRGALATVESGTRWRVLGYFSCIGLGFLFLEIAFIQKFVLYLSHPLYSMAVVLCAFLIFAGVGSGYSRRLEYSLGPGFNGRASLRWAIAGLTVLAVAYLAVLPVVFQWTLSSSELVRIVITVLLIAPLAFFMGMPFPVMLGEIARTHGELVPWAWAINGCASVVSAVLALILAMAAGFSWLVASAVVLYWVAAMVAPWFERRFDS
jgi:hypothetical protein